MKYSKEEAIELLGLPFLVKTSMLKDIPDVDFVCPILEIGQRGIIDMLLYHDDGITLNLFVDDDCVDLDKTQFEQHCQVFKPVEAA